MLAAFLSLFRFPGLCLLAVALSSSALAQGHAQSSSPIPKILFDTDMDTDCDDAGAMAVLHALADRGECEILATVVSVTHPGAAPTVAAINAYYGRPDLPIGAPKKNGKSHPSKYVDQIAKEFPQSLKSTADVPDAALVYRDILEKQPDQTVTIVTVGYLTNLRNLLELPAEGSHASGADLVKQKVKLYVCMGGNFIGSPAKDDLKLGNVNFTREPGSVLKVIREWPTPIVFAGREVCSVPSGLQIGSSLANTPMNNPVRRSYEHYFGGTAKDRHVADLATVLYAVRGHRDYWDIQSTGYMDLKDDMTFEWKSSPDKDQSYLLKKKDVSGKPNDAYVESVLDELLIQPPAASIKEQDKSADNLREGILTQEDSPPIKETRHRLPFSFPDYSGHWKKAGNTQNEEERHRLLLEMSMDPVLSSEQRAEAATLAAFVEKWMQGGLKFYSKQWDAYDFGISEKSRLYPITALYQGRMRAWQLIENSTIRSHPVEGPKLHQRACEDFRRFQKAFPENPIPGMYLGQAIPWEKSFPDTPDAPEWAVLQREQIERLRDIIHWWIDHRQREDGQFGGGWGDDCEMWRWWAVVLMGFEDKKSLEAQLKFSKSAMNRPHLKGGFNQEITDVEHAAEDTTDNLIPLMALEPENQRWKDWALKMGPFMRDAWTGKNERGQLQFKSFYFSATDTSPVPTRAFDVMANVGALHPAFLIWQQQNDSVLDEVLPAWLDTWVDATARAENGKPAGILPSSIRWPDGAAAGAEKPWWEPVKPGGYMHSYYIWPSVITELTDALIIAHVKTGKDKYLQPLRSMAAMRLKWLREKGTTHAKPGSEAWCAENLGPRENANSNFGALVKSLARCKALTGTTEFDELLALESAQYTLRSDASGREEITAALRDSAKALRVNFAGFTSEVRSTDRVMRFAQFLAEDYKFDDYKGVTLPKHELLYRMVSGDTNAPRFPQMAVRWLTPAKDIAVFVTKANTNHLTAELFHFGKEDRFLEAELRLLKPGRYKASLKEAGNVSTLPAIEVKAGPFSRLSLKLPPGKLATLDIQPEG
ncbi:nucleoside hydrolase [Roseimicrobium sp. ORNL1]|uniref:nucleoside hydrolase n=1 Tax=Roseimicrobium sp. ORNL1 TaxID=2711231 RepID=UPI0013E1EEC5|nr:nucleoside hydrolase [Roseimicrobium sp. ORNL1]QIF01527.1 hypothetical protein G5S37_08325 [Roseimicrobium sp. ORNL1]